MKLYLVGTPIGNLSDISPRGIEILKGVDFIAAEDTRVTLKLLNHFDIKTPMISYHEHNMREAGRRVVGRILNGESCAVVTDAGMPCISDPGEQLVRLCIQSNIDICPIPGPSAVIAALCVSGMDTSRFCFEGFLSSDKGKRLSQLTELSVETRTMIFYEAPHRLISTLKEMLEQLGNREIAVVKELTKIHEKVIRTTIQQAVEYFKTITPKGEFVLVVEAAAEKAEESFTLNQAAELAKELTERGHKPSDAARQAAKLSGYKKSEIYKLIIS